MRYLPWQSPYDFRRVHLEGILHSYWRYVLYNDQNDVLCGVCFEVVPRRAGAAAFCSYCRVWVHTQCCAVANQGGYICCDCEEGEA